MPNRVPLRAAALVALSLVGSAASADEVVDLYRQLQAGPCATQLPALRQAAEAGQALSQDVLGIAYDYGTCLPKGDVQALQWYRKAAEQGYADAQNNLGVMYEKGRGVPKDDALAAQWYRKAAEQGHTLAQMNLGLMYENGRGVAQDDAQAVRWYRKAAEQGDADAQNNLGLMYENGRGVLQDAQTAAQWYEKSARQGDAWGQRNLARLLRDGNGVPQDLVRAHAWFNLASAADEPHPRAAEERGELARELSSAALADAQRLAREWQPGSPMGAPRVKAAAAKPKASPKAQPQPVSTGPFPPRPAAQPGALTCNTRCVNGDCYRTYSNGKQVRFQAERRFNPLTNQWEFDGGSC